jgi:1-acyl-sn-glycerol-3-phosphate acyltransferase
MREIYQSGHLPVRNQLGYIAASRFLFDPYLNRRGLEVEGIENLPGGSAPYILAANHRSLLDVPVLGQILLEHDGSQIHFVAKKELWKHKIMAKYLDSTDVIKYDRDLQMSKQPDAAGKMADVLQNNGVLGMFPEHTRRKGAKLQIEKRGLGMLAVANYAPIATAGIYGTDSLWGRLYVKFGKTIYPGSLGPDNTRRRMVEIENEYTQALQEAIYGAYEMAGISIPSELEPTQIEI